MKVMEKEEEKTIQETPHERFKRLASKRTNEVLRRLKILGNCANRQVYEYTNEDIEKIFSTIEKRAKEIKAKFRISKQEDFTL